MITDIDMKTDMTDFDCTAKTVSQSTTLFDLPLNTSFSYGGLIRWLYIHI